MGESFLMARKWSLASKFAITDSAGTPRFTVEGSFPFRKLSLCDTTGGEVAVISRRGLARRYEILADGQVTTVRPRGFFRQRFEVETMGGLLEGHGNFSGRRYAITRSGVLAAGVTQMRSLRERFTIEVADAENPVLMLAVVLVIETIRDERRRNASAASGA